MKIKINDKIVNISTWDVFKMWIVGYFFFWLIIVVFFIGLMIGGML